MTEHAPPPSALETDPEYRAAVIDLLGVLAYGELTAFERIAADAAIAPSIDDKAALAGMATAEYRHFLLLRDRLAQMGVDPAEAMAPFRRAYEDYHAQTTPNDWLEGMVKAYVGDGIGMDFYREIAAYVDEDTRALVLDVCDDLGQSAIVVDRVRAAIQEDPRAGGRLALWLAALHGPKLGQFIVQCPSGFRDGGPNELDPKAYAKALVTFPDRVPDEKKSDAIKGANRTAGHCYNAPGKGVVDDSVFRDPTVISSSISMELTNGNCSICRPIPTNSILSMVNPKWPKLKRV